MFSEKDFFKEINYLAVGSRLKRLYDYFVSETREIYQSQNKNFEPRWFTLFYLLKNYPNLSVNEASERLGYTHSAVSQTAKELIKEELVESVNSEEDKRVRRLKLTKKGKSFIVELESVFFAIKDVLTELVNENNSDLLFSIERLEESINKKGMFERFKAKEKKRQYDSIEIIEFDQENKDHFIEFEKISLDWLHEFFSEDLIEPFDYEFLKNPKKYIIDEGGRIIFAVLDNKIVGTCCVFKREDGLYEIGKLGVKKECQGKQAGKKLLEGVLNISREIGLTKVYLTTTAKLVPAINLYRKYGFKYSELDLCAKYKRADITMEFDLEEKFASLHS